MLSFRDRTLSALTARPSSSTISYILFIKNLILSFRDRTLTERWAIELHYTHKEIEL
jgi:hypothetical protein